MSEKTSRQEQVVSFDSNVYSLIAVKKAAYRFIDLFAANIELGEREIVCRLHFTQPRSEEGCLRAVDEFRKEALDQDLRERIKAETEPVRNLILAHAFSKTGIVGDEQVPKD